MTPQELERDRARRAIRPGRTRMQRKACVLVQLAIRRGVLKKISGQSCIDCGKPADCYDHRFYSRPLEVEPVCFGCNKRRGSAWDLEILCIEMGETK